MTLLEAALSYAAKGWPVFPCNAAKEPYTKNGVIEATTDRETITDWWARWPRANVAMDVGGAGMMVLDLDPGHSIKELEAVVGPLPATLLEAHTPRGGRHLFYALEPGEVVPPSASKVADHVDVRSFHSYVLLAPSRTDDGVYTWDSEGKPAYRSDEMVRQASTARAKSRDRDHWIITPDLPENVADAVKWLKIDAKVAVEGQGGDTCAYATAAMLKSFGISQSLAFDLMWEHWNPRCMPPWDNGEVDHLEAKINNGYSYNTSPPGNVTAAYTTAKAADLFRPVEVTLPSGSEYTSGRFRIVDRAGMDHIAPPEWIVNDLLPVKSYAMLYGPFGTYKTFVALDIALSVATGFAQQSNWVVARPGPVLFLAGEGRSGLRARVQAWEREHWKGNHAEGFHLGDPVPLVSEDMTPLFEAAKRLSSEYRLVVIDTVGRAMQGLNENAQENASAFTGLVQRFQRELGAAVLAIHHTGHDTKSTHARGSSVFGADADALYRLEKQAGSGRTVAMHNNPDQGGKQKDAAAWDQPRLFDMRQIVLSPRVNTLVPVPHKQSDEPLKDANLGSEFGVIDRAIAEVLGANKLKPWSNRDLAEMLATRPDIEIGSKSLQNKYLRTLRETNGTLASACYDALTKRWRMAG